MNTKWILASAIASTVASLPAAATAETALAFSPVSMDVPVMQGISGMLEGRSTQAGYDYLVVDPKFDPVQQTQQLLPLIETGRIDAALVVVLNGPALKPAMDAAIQNGVALHVSGAPDAFGFEGPQPGIAFSVTNYAKLGGSLGSELAECVSASGAEGAKIIEFIGTLETEKQTIEMARSAFSDGIGTEAKVAKQIVASDPVAAQQEVMQVLQANPDVVGVTALYNEQSLGAINAFEALGRDIPCIVSGGGGPAAEAFVEEGKIHSVVAFDFAGIIGGAFPILQDMMADPSADGPIIDVPLKLVSKD